MRRKKIKRYAILAAVIMLLGAFAIGKIGRPVATILNSSNLVMNKVTLSACNGEWSRTWERLEPGESVACVINMTQSESAVRLEFVLPAGEIVIEEGGYIEGGGGYAVDFRVLKDSKVDSEYTDGEWRLRRLMLR